MAWGARAARGSGVRGGPKGTRTAYFYNGAFAPFGRSWGAPFAAHEVPALHRRRSTAIRSRSPTRSCRHRPASRADLDPAGPASRR